MAQDFVNIVLTGDENYVIPMGVAMNSIIKNLSRNKTARFFLLVSGWDKKQEQEIRKLRNCVIEIIHAEKHLHYFNSVDINKFKLSYIKSLTPYYRLLIPKVLPQDVDKVFYFDADMIADADLSELQDYVPDNILIAAVAELVANVGYKRVLAHLKEYREFDKFNTNRFSAPYFNAGFFLMNLKMARELNIFDDFMTFLGNHPNPPYADQDTLNAVCGQKYSDKTLLLHPRWNVFADMPLDVNTYGGFLYPFHMVHEAFQAPYIYHYAGPNKPWINNDCTNFIEVWHRYYRLSPFFESNKDEYLNIQQYGWINVFGIPVIRTITKAKEYKSFLFGVLPIKRIYADKRKYYFCGIPVVKLFYSDGEKFRSAYLFHFIPIIRKHK